MASQAERQVYQEKKYGNCTEMSAQVATDTIKPEVYLATGDSVDHFTLQAE